MKQSNTISEQQKQIKTKKTKKSLRKTTTPIYRLFPLLGGTIRNEPTVHRRTCEHYQTDEQDAAIKTGLGRHGREQAASLIKSQRKKRRHRSLRTPRSLNRLFRAILNSIT